MGDSSLIASGPKILAINGGSSSLKFAMFANPAAPSRVLSGSVERIGTGEALLKTVSKDGAKTETKVDAANQESALGAILEQLGSSLPVAIGHRVVHGGSRYSSPVRIDSQVIADLKQMSTFDPDHLPGEIALIEAMAQRHPEIPQVACFDTEFHAMLPRVAKLLPIPRKYESQGVRRYGFHGLSYAFLMESLEKIGAANGRVILAHLGSGASLAAVKDGKPMDTTMGFTPTAGLVMGTRTGDLDPGVVAFLARADGISVDDFHEMVNKKSGLLGVSETSSDVRDLIAKRSNDVRAAEAIDLFCHAARKHIAGMAASLDGVDTLVFSGGIGENSVEIRSEICSGLRFLGIELDPANNASGAAMISTNASRVCVRVIATDEEVMIVKNVLKTLKFGEN